MTDTLSQLFASAAELADHGPVSKAYGHVYGGRYHMPYLPDETPTKSCPTWVPGGLMRTTNLASAFSDTEALNIWEHEQFGIGLAFDTSLYEELCILVHQALREGVNFQRLDLHPAIRKAITGGWKERDASIVGRAKQVAGANRARQAGTNRHIGWEHRGATGELIGTPDMRAQVEALEALLESHHLRRVPGLSERTVRNMEVNCAGRFDDILQHTITGELFMADLKNKSRRFWTWLEVDIQLAIYARSEYMLEHPPTGEAFYVPGPRRHVSQEKGVVMVVPSDGTEPYLRKADLVRGWQNALLARRIVDERAYGKSAGRRALAEWTDETGE
jgi:hypothetical protein